MKSNKKNLLNKAVALGLTASLAIPFAVLSEQGVKAAVTTGSIELSLLDDDGKTFVSGSDVVIKNLSTQTGAAPVDYTTAWGFDGATADATTSSAVVTETGLEPGKYAVTAEVNASTTVTTFVDVKASDKATKVKAIALPDSTKVDQKKSGKISATLDALKGKKVVIKNATTAWVTTADAGTGKFEVFVPAGTYDIILDADSGKKNNKYSVKVQAGQNSLPFEDLAADSVANDDLGFDLTETTVTNTSKKYEGKANVGATVRAYTYDDNTTPGDTTDDEYTLIGEATSKAKTTGATLGDFSITLAKAQPNKKIKFVVADSALNQKVSDATTLGVINPAFTASTTAVAGKDVTLTFTDGSGLLATASDLVVKLKKSGEADGTYTTLVKGTDKDYTITNGKLTIKAAAFLAKNPTGSASDTDYVISVTAAGFQDSTVTQKVTAAVAPALTATVAKATTAGIKLSATKTTGSTNKIYYTISGTEATAPKLYAVVNPAGFTELTTSPTDNITSGVEKDKFLAVYELDASNRVVKYKQIKLTSTQIKLPELSGVSFADAVGSGKDGKTVITLPTAGLGNTFKYIVSSNTSAVPAPGLGQDVSDWTTVTNGAEVTAANGKHIGVAEVDGSNKVVKFVDKTAVSVAYVAAKPAVETADSNLGSSVAFDTAVKIVLNGQDVALTNVIALGAAYSAATNIDTVVTELQKDIDAVYDGVAHSAATFKVSKSGTKLVITSDATGAAAEVDLTGSPTTTGATLLGFTTLNAVNGADAAN